MFLISYRSEYRGGVVYGMDTTHDPIAWLWQVNEEFPETYILLNQLEISREVEKEISGEFRGM